jgi:hypothetical protein
VTYYVSLVTWPIHQLHFHSNVTVLLYNNGNRGNNGLFAVKQQFKQKHYYGYGSVIHEWEIFRTVVIELEELETVGFENRSSEDIRSSGLVNGRLMMCRGAVVECKWTDSPTMDCPDVCLEAFWLQEWERVLEDCNKRSCWKNSIGLGVPRPCGSDVYVCSKSCRLCLTVVYWLLECNKAPSRIENTEYVTIWTFRLCFSYVIQLSLVQSTQLFYIYHVTATCSMWITSLSVCIPLH